MRLLFKKFEKVASAMLLLLFVLPFKYNGTNKISFRCCKRQ